MRVSHHQQDGGVLFGAGPPEQYRQLRRIAAARCCPQLAQTTLKIFLALEIKPRPDSEVLLLSQPLPRLTSVHCLCYQ